MATHSFQLKPLSFRSYPHQYDALTHKWDDYVYMRKLRAVNLAAATKPLTSAIRDTKVTRSNVDTFINKVEIAHQRLLLELPEIIPVQFEFKKIQKPKKESVSSSSLPCPPTVRDLIAQAKALLAKPAAKPLPRVEPIIKRLGYAQNPASLCVEKRVFTDEAIAHAASKRDTHISIVSTIRNPVKPYNRFDIITLAKPAGALPKIMVASSRRKTTTLGRRLKPIHRTSHRACKPVLTKFVASMRTNNVDSNKRFINSILDATPWHVPVLITPNRDPELLRRLREIRFELRHGGSWPSPPTSDVPAPSVPPIVSQSIDSSIPFALAVTRLEHSPYATAPRMIPLFMRKFEQFAIYQTTETLASFASEYFKCDASAHCYTNTCLIRYIMKHFPKPEIFNVHLAHSVHHDHIPQAIWSWWMETIGVLIALHDPTFIPDSTLPRTSRLLEEARHFFAGTKYLYIIRNRQTGRCHSHHTNPEIVKYCHFRAINFQWDCSDIHRRPLYIQPDRSQAPFLQPMDVTANQHLGELLAYDWWEGLWINGSYHGVVNLNRTLSRVGPLHSTDTLLPVPIPDLLRESFQSDFEINIPETPRLSSQGPAWRATDILVYISAINDDSEIHIINFSWLLHRDIIFDFPTAPCLSETLHRLRFHPKDRALKCAIQELWTRSKPLHDTRYSQCDHRVHALLSAALMWSDCWPDELDRSVDDWDPHPYVSSVVSQGPLDSIRTAITGGPSDGPSRIGILDSISAAGHASSNIAELSEHARTALFKIETLTESATEWFAISKSTLASVDSMAKNISESSNNISNKTSATLDSVMGGFNNALVILPMLAAVALSFKYPVAGAMLAGVAGVTWLSFTLDVDLWKIVSPYFNMLVKRQEEPVTTSQALWEDGTVNAFASITALATAWVCGKSVFNLLEFPSWGSTRHAINDLNYSVSGHARACTGWGNFGQTFISIVETVVNFIRRGLGKEAILLRRTPYNSFNEWRVRVHKCLMLFDLAKWPVKPDHLDELCRLRAEGRAFLDEFKMDKEVVLLANKMVAQLHEICISNGAVFAANNGTRAAPDVLLLCGDPGIGKTILLPVLANEILLGILPAERIRALNYNLKSEIFQKGNSPYWEGYGNQKIFVSDDIWQATIAPGAETNDTLEFIKLANSWSMPLNMANLADKGRKNFDSKCMLMTTNMTAMNTTLSAAVHNVDAVVRRFDHPYKLLMHDDFVLVNPVPDAPKRLDFAKVHEYQKKEGTFPWHAWAVIRWNYLIGQPQAGAAVEPLYPLVERIIKNIRSKQQTHLDMSDFLVRRNYIDSLARKESEATRDQFAREAVKDPKVQFQPEVRPPETIYDDLSVRTDTPSYGIVSKPAVPNHTLPEYIPVPSSNPPTTHHGPRRSHPVAQGSASSSSEYHDFPTLPFVEVDLSESMFQEPILQLQHDIPQVQKFLTFSQLASNSMSAAWSSLTATAESVAGGVLGFLLHATGALGLAWLFGKAIGFILDLLFKTCAATTGAIGDLSSAISSKLSRAFCKEDFIDPATGQDIEEVTPAVLLRAYDRVKAQGGSVASSQPDERLNPTHSVTRSSRQASKKGGMAGRSYKGAPVHSQALEVWEQPVELSESRIAKGLPAFDFEGLRFTGDKTSVDIAKSIANNLYHVTVHNDALPPSNFEGTLTMVRDNLGIMPLHYMENWKLASKLGRTMNSESTICFTCTGSAEYEVQYKLKDIFRMHCIQVPESDLIMIQFAIDGLCNFRAQRDIVDKFLLEEHVDSIDSAYIRLEVNRLEPRRLLNQRVAKAHYDGSSITYCNASRTLPETTLHRTVRYDMRTAEGECGSLVFLEQKPHTGCHKIIGFHTAGDGRVGFCNIVTAEELETFCAAFPNTIRSKIGEEISPISDESFSMVLGDIVPQGTDDPTLLGGSFTYLGRTTRPFSTNTRSGIWPTALKNAWGVDPRRPAMLKPTVVGGVEIRPMENALRAYSSPVLSLDTRLINEAANVAFAPLLRLTSDHTRRILTFEEAVIGCPDMTNCSSIPRAKSPGYPYNTQNITNKKFWFGGGEEFDFDNPRARALKATVLMIIDDARQGIRNFHVYTDFLKDELRTLAKVQAGKTRLISGAPMAYVLAWRMYFSAFTSAVQSSRIHNGIAVGIDHNQEWGTAVHYLTRKGGHCIAGDFSQYDASCQPQVHDSILNQINFWYGDEHELVRRVLFLEVSYSRHLGGLGLSRSTVYQWSKALPSGHPATSILNSLYNLVLWVVVWYRIAGSLLGPRFWDFIGPLVYGDDNIVNIDETMTHIFNQETVIEHFAAFGMKYTDESKGVGSLVAPTRSLVECSFLKRGFAYDQALQRWVAPLSLDTVLFIPYWCSNSKLLREITHTNVEVCCLELSLHTQQVWDEYFPRIRRSAYDLAGFVMPRVDKLEWAHACVAHGTWL